MHSSPAISSYFVTYGPVSEPTLDGDMFIVPGIECYHDITQKTITALEYFLERTSYDFVIRSNMSSVWDFKLLVQRLETLPRTDLYYGEFLHDFWDVSHLDLVGFSVAWVSGSGIIFTPDVCRKLIEHKQVAISFHIVDDVDFGYTLNQIGVRITPGKRIKVGDDTMDIPTGHYHYWVRLLPQPDNVIERTIACMDLILKRQS